MKTRTVLLLAAMSATFWAQSTPPPPTVARLYEGPVNSAGREMISLAEAMPASAYGFRPKDGAFGDVRTFAEQAKHAAAVVVLVSAAILNEAPPLGVTDENGPAAAATKEQIVKFLTDAFAYGRKAMQTMTAENQIQLAKSPFGSGQATRGSLAAEAAWHSFDHYGQMVVYARMNKVVPPASMPAPPAPAQKKK